MEIQNQQIKEEEKECPSCGALLVNALQHRTVSVSISKQAAVVNNATSKSVQFRTAFHQIEDNSVKFG